MQLMGWPKNMFYLALKLPLFFLSFYDIMGITKEFQKVLPFQEITNLQGSLFSLMSFLLNVLGIELLWANWANRYTRVTIQICRKHPLE